MGWGMGISIGNHDGEVTEGRTRASCLHMDTRWIVLIALLVANFVYGFRHELYRQRLWRRGIEQLIRAEHRERNAVIVKPLSQ